MSDLAVKDNFTTRMLATVERVGNKLPDPAMLFVGLLVIVWVLSWLLSYVSFDQIDPRSGEAILIKNLLLDGSGQFFPHGSGRVRAVE